MWPDIAAWFQSPGGARVLQTAIVPALAILVAGLLAALISRAALRAALRRADREQAATAVAGLVEAARAASDSDGARDRRRAARLRTEADVRMRLLPLQGADRAADWAAAATEALAATHGSGAATDLAAVRDPLVAWVRNPRRAKRLFARPAAVTAPAPARPADDASTPAEERPGQEQDRFGPLRTRTDADLPPVRTDDEDDQAVPAWRRTRSAERLQQEHDARTEPETEPGAVDEGTAPSRRLDEPQQAEDQEQADAQPARRTTAVAVDADAEPQPARARPVPEWLDTYDDDAEVTQNLDLRTPPPVSATKVRDRSPAADIVPRP